MTTNNRWRSRQILIGASIALTALSLGACTDSPTSPPDAQSPERDGAAAATSYATITLWTKQVVGTLSGHILSRGRDVSDSGIVVGESVQPFGAPDMPFYWTKQYGIRQLNVLSSAAGGGRALAISDDGRYVTGYMVINSVTVPVRWRFTGTPGFSSQAVRELPRCQYGLSGTGYAVNNAGQVVGHLAGGAVLGE